MSARRIVGTSVVCSLLLAWALSPPGALAANQPAPDPRSLAELPIEDLLNIEVTSVARQQQSLSESAAAVFVITQDDIRRSGVTTISELFRMVPGLAVAQITANTWAITARGFNAQFANKMLVLMDGRTLYTPLFSGVLWDTQDTVLLDIDRIEIIRGPGASVWGTNAVNGVINITTKSAKETRGGLLHATAGTEDRAIGSLRYGGTLRQGAAYRVYAKSFTRDAFQRDTGGEAADDWNSLRTGFRIDGSVAGDDSWTIQGDAYRGRTGNTITALSLSPPYEAPDDIREEVAGANVLGRWSHEISSTSGHSLQVYLDAYDRQSDLFGERRVTYDADFQHHFAPGRNQQLIWGVQARRTGDRTNDTFRTAFTPDRRDDDFFSAFVEDMVSLADGRWRLTLGSKFEHNDYIGFEVEPTVRLLARLGDRSTAWAAVSRAVRSPSRADRHSRVNLAAFPTLGPPALLSVFGNPGMNPEEGRAFELGYRAQWSDAVSFDAAAFYNLYEGLRTAEREASFVEASPPPPHLVVPLRFANRADGHSYGAEVVCNWRVTDHWRLSAWYAWLRVAIEPDASSTTTSPPEEADVPRHMAYLRSTLELPRAFFLETSLNFVDRLRKQDVPSYLRTDLRLGWRVSSRIEASAGVRNALDRLHAEARPPRSVFEPTLIERSYDVRLTWKF